MNLLNARSFLSRREALQRLACGVGGIALCDLMAPNAMARPESVTKALSGSQVIGATGATDFRRPIPHHLPRAKSLIFLNMQGGPSQFESFDYKPSLEKHAGQELSDAKRAGAKILPPLCKFARCGRSGLEISELFPHLGSVADDLCVIKSMVSDDNSHPGGQRQALTGFARQPMASIGSWLLYGLGSENKNLPGFVYLSNGLHHGSGFLPAQTQGMPIGRSLPNLKRKGPGNEAQQREDLDLLARLNREHADARLGDDDILNARIEAAELAFRMQMAVPEAVDVSAESAATLNLYGISGGDIRGARVTPALPETRAEFGTMCLTARRLVERGVRVVTICVGARRGWDHHQNLKAGFSHNAAVIDQPIAALLKDLKAHGLLDSTLVMWGGEFGRTPYAQNGDGRDHFARAFTYWLAGGGAKGGTSYGQTDDLGLRLSISLNTMPCRGNTVYQ